MNEIDVLVVGAGPTGLRLALGLTRGDAIVVVRPDGYVAVTAPLVTADALIDA